MPIEIKVTKEIGNYEPKFIGPFTTRQCVTFGLGAIFAVLIYNTAAKFLPKPIPGYLCLIPAGVAVLFNWKPYGMKFEKFVQSIFVNTFLAPTHRRYRTENTMEERIIKLANAEIVIETALNAPPKKGRKNSKKKEVSVDLPDDKKGGDNSNNVSTKKGKVGKKAKPEKKKKKADKKTKATSYKMSPKAIR